MAYKTFFYINPPTKVRYLRSRCDRPLRRRRNSTFKFEYAFTLISMAFAKSKKTIKGFNIHDFGGLEDNYHKYKRCYSKTIIVVEIKKGSKKEPFDRTSVFDC